MPQPRPAIEARSRPAADRAGAIGAMPPHYAALEKPLPPHSSGAIMKLT